MHRLISLWFVSFVNSFNLRDLHSLFQKEKKKHTNLLWYFGRLEKSDWTCLAATLYGPFQFSSSSHLLYSMHTCTPFIDRYFSLKFILYFATGYKFPHSDQICSRSILYHFFSRSLSSLSYWAFGALKWKTMDYKSNKVYCKGVDEKDKTTKENQRERESERVDWKTFVVNAKAEDLMINSAGSLKLIKSLQSSWMSRWRRTKSIKGKYEVNDER